MPTTDIVGHAISPDLEIMISGDTRVISNELKTKIDEIWDAAIRASGPTLFNGTLYSVTDIQPDRITVRPVEFKQFYAQNQEDALFVELGIRPLACTGVVRCAEGLIFAKRSESVMLNQGYWELGPSGVFDDAAKCEDSTLSTQAVFTGELVEELGIPESVSQTEDILVAFEDKGQRSIDLILSASVSIDAAKVHDYFGSRETDEYSEVKVIPDKGIRGFISQSAVSVLPLSLSILDTLGLE